jgi:hypothetical protein
MQTKVEAKSTLAHFAPTHTGLIQRKCADGECPERRKKRLMLQRRSTGETELSEVPPIVHEVLRTPGQPLDMETRTFMELNFGHDFSKVRVHKDVKAAESTRAVNALAYTVGHDIVFGSGRYAPTKMYGQYLIAHELAHVAQREGTTNSIQPLSLEPDNSPAESEASAVANAIVSGQPVPAISTVAPNGTVCRSVLGAIGGSLLGAGVGAGLGFLVGGPIGAIVGGLIGGVAGLITGETATADARALSSEEESEAKIVFGRNMNWGKVRLAESAIMSIGGYARTPFDTVYFPPGTLARPLAERMPFMIHELTHVWQTQHGYSVFEKLFWALHGERAYNYGGEENLRRAHEQRKHFTDFNTEQQGDICEDYYIKKKKGLDVSAYEPFIAEVKGESWPDVMRQPGDFPVNIGPNLYA